MASVVGLDGHVRRNIKISRAIIAGFLVATCVCWVLMCVSYNVTFRYFLGEELHAGMFASRTFTSRRVEGVDMPARPREAPPPLTLPALALEGVAFSVRRLYIPATFVLGWLVYFWLQSGAVMRWATGATSASRATERELFTIVENLAIQTGQPVPAVEVIETPALNAYAYGLDPAHATIGVTRGLLRTLPRRELETVVAHEFAHILNRDTRVMMLASVFVGIFEEVGRYFLSGITGAHEKGLEGKPALRAIRIACIAPVLPLFGAMVASAAASFLPSVLARAKLSRSREFMADAGAVELTKDADALVCALIRIERADHHVDVAASAQAMMIASRVAGLLATHPTIEERVAALRAFAGALPPDARRAPARRPAAIVGGSREPSPVFGRRAASQGGGIRSQQRRTQFGVR